MSSRLEEGKCGPKANPTFHGPDPCSSSTKTESIQYLKDLSNHSLDFDRPRNRVRRRSAAAPLENEVGEWETTLMVCHRQKHTSSVGPLLSYFSSRHHQHIDSRSTQTSVVLMICAGMSSLDQNTHRQWSPPPICCD